jgi:hypothetical protein
MKLLSQLLDKLIEPINAWKMFTSPNGDVEYFRDPHSDPTSESFQRQRRSHVSLQVLSETFKTMESLHHKLQSFKESCSNSSREVSRLLALMLLAKGCPGELLLLIGLFVARTSFDS